MLILLTAMTETIFNAWVRSNLWSAILSRSLAVLDLAINSSTALEDREDFRKVSGTVVVSLVDRAAKAAATMGSGMRGSMRMGGGGIWELITLDEFAAGLGDTAWDGISCTGLFCGFCRFSAIDSLQFTGHGRRRVTVACLDELVGHGTRGEPSLKI